MPELLLLATCVGLAGLAGGLLAGLLGVGGGIIIVPVLDFVFGVLGVAADVRMHLAVGTSLASIVPTAIASSRSHRARGGVDEQVARRWAPWIAIGASAGALLASAVSGQVLSAVFAAVATFAAVRMLLPRLREGRAGQVRAGAWTRTLPAGIGLVSALMGIGGGTLSVPALAWLGLPMHRAVGTSAWLGLWIALPAAAGFAVTGWGHPGLPPASLGYVSLLSVALLLPATWLAAPWGVRLAHRLSPRLLRGVFGGFLLLFALRMLYRTLA